MKYLWVLMLAISLLACNSIEKEIAATEAEVIRLHDVETMPKMGKLFNLSKQLKSYRDSLNIAQDSSLDISINATIKNLGKAEEDMMQWMKSYGESIQNIEVKSPEERLQFYKGEVVKMEDLKVLMLGSIETAETILKKSKK